MKNKLLIATILASLVAVVAYAQVDPRTLGDVFNRRAVVISKDTANSDPRAGALHIGRLGTGREFPSTTSRITRLIRGTTAAIDFASATITCVDSAAQTVSGARVGDICIVNPLASSIVANSSFTCRVSATDQVIIRFCAAGTAADPASTTYDLLLLSNQ